MTTDGDHAQVGWLWGFERIALEVKGGGMRQSPDHVRFQHKTPTLTLATGCSRLKKG